MAFRQPTHHHHHHQPRNPELEAVSPVNVQSPQPYEQLDESQEWILFSQNPASTTDRTYTASTQRTGFTTGQSRRSEYGSLDTAARSQFYEEDISEATDVVIEEEEDGELDSLDSHLHEFRAETSAFREASIEDVNLGGIPVLPTHDGLGSFRIDRTAMGEGIQEHIYAFEQYNPRRIKRRRESLELGQFALENERMLEHENARRIEEWRLGQSRALLDEIQKETRRRRQSLFSEQRNISNDGQEEEAATLGNVVSDNLDHENQHQEYESDGFWSRITRRVIRDLMGIDDNLLSILFGESLPEDVGMSLTPPANGIYSRETVIRADMENDTWEYRLLNRISRELGLLVHHLSDHPGAFSTYLKLQQMPLPYAGLPIIPEVGPDVPQDAEKSATVASALHFQPTIQMSTKPIDIPGALPRSTFGSDRMVYDADATLRPQILLHQTLETGDSTVEFTKEEWEKQLDIKMVFRYLRSRFSPRPVSNPTFSRDPSYLAVSSPQDVAARIARVRQHHPLVTRQKPAERRTFKVTVPSNPILHRRGSSCASQSTRKSARRNSGSSRHYWDINGSIGSGSLIASAGAWGEV